MKRISTVVAVAAILATIASSQENKPASSSLLKTSFGKLPIYFIENRGIYPDAVKFYVQGADKTLFFTKDGITFRLKGKDRAWVVKLEFVGANPDVIPRGKDKQQAVFSYFKGPEKDWKTGLRTFSKVVYEDLWPDIDLVYRGTVNRLKYEFVVKPGADPSRIRLRYRGVTLLEVNRDGVLEVRTPEGSFSDARPEAWYEGDGEPVRVDLAYRLSPPRVQGDIEFGFAVGDYDRTRPLVLDPAIFVYSGFIGGIEYDGGLSIAVDAAGNAYVAGLTSSDQRSFPVKAGPILVRSSVRWDWDVFVAKVNAQGTALVYCGYINGAAEERGLGIAVDASGNAYVTGFTQSDEKSFPVKVGPDLTHNGGEDAFVAKVNPNGTGLVYCGYLGGSGRDRGRGIAVDGSGHAYVTGHTGSTEKTFPVWFGPDLTHNGGNDVFVAKLNAKGTGPVYCGYVGGSGSEGGHGIALDGSGNAYLTGQTSSSPPTFPVKAGPDLTPNGSTDAFVAKVDAKGFGLDYCGYIGGSSKDEASGIAVDSTGAAYVTGTTFSNQKTFPARVGPDLTHNGSGDAFVAKVNAQGSGLAYCGYIGGDQVDYAHGIAVDRDGNAYLTGETPTHFHTNPKGFPEKEGPDLTPNGYTDAFVAKVNATGAALVYCGYIGGVDDEVGRGIAVDVAGNAYVTGETDSGSPAIVGPDLTMNGSFDCFVSKISLTLLTGSGAPQPGGTVTFALTASDDVGLAYQVGTSLGSGPIPIDKRSLGLSLDHVLLASVNSAVPTVFSGYQGMIGAGGRAAAVVRIPDSHAMIGLRIHTAFVTLDPAAPSGIKSISNTFSFSVTK